MVEEEEACYTAAWDGRNKREATAERGKGFISSNPSHLYLTNPVSEGRIMNDEKRQKTIILAQCTMHVP
jgi:hypothetical protein